MSSGRPNSLLRLLMALREWWQARRRSTAREWLGVGGGELHRRGWRAESYAVTFLTRTGYHILNRNVRVGPGEIDIVAEHEGLLVFVEVRARQEGALRRPAATLTRAKRRRVRRCAEEYVRRRGLRGTRFRCDVVEVYLDGRGRPVRAEVHRGAV